MELLKKKIEKKEKKINYQEKIKNEIINEKVKL